VSLNNIIRNPNTVPGIQNPEITRSRGCPIGAMVRERGSNHLVSTRRDPSRFEYEEVPALHHLPVPGAPVAFAVIQATIELPVHETRRQGEVQESS